MSVRSVRLGTARRRGEGLRIGTVRHPPRGVPKSQHAAQDWYDVWLPELAPSAALLEQGLVRAGARLRSPSARCASADSRVGLLAARDERAWAAFARRYRREMSAPEKQHLLGLLAALSQHASFSVGCYCEDESRCHRSLLREMLVEKGAQVSR